MKRLVAVSVVVCVLLIATAYAQNTGMAPAASSGLKDAFAGKFLIGTAGDIPKGYSEAELANIRPYRRRNRSVLPVNYGYRNGGFYHGFQRHR